MAKFILSMNSAEFKRLSTAVKGTKLEKIVGKAKITFPSTLKKNAVTKATKVRIQRTINGIERGIEILEKTRSRITLTSIADKGKVSYNSVRKYISDERLEELNDNYILNS